MPAAAWFRCSHLGWATRGVPVRSPPVFPATGFALLGVLSLAAAAVFVGRAVAVAATAERMWSAVLFALVGTFWLVAYWSARGGPTR